MANLFVEIKQEKDTCPIFLIDKSGSTNDVMRSGLSIFKTFANIAKKNLKKDKIKQCHLLFWSDKTKVYTEPINTANIKDHFDEIDVGGQTDISVAFHTMPRT